MRRCGIAAAALADELPLNKRDGGFGRGRHESALDEARALRDESRKVIASLQARYAELAETRTEDQHNNFWGFQSRCRGPGREAGAPAVQRPFRASPDDGRRDALLDHRACRLEARSSSAAPGR